MCDYEQKLYLASAELEIKVEDEIRNKLRKR